MHLAFWRAFFGFAAFVARSAYFNIIKVRLTAWLARLLRAALPCLFYGVPCFLALPFALGFLACRLFLKGGAVSLVILSASEVSTQSKRGFFAALKMTKPCRCLAPFLLMKRRRLAFGVVFKKRCARLFGFAFCSLAALAFYGVPLTTHPQPPPQGRGLCVALPCDSPVIASRFLKRRGNLGRTASVERFALLVWHCLVILSVSEKSIDKVWILRLWLRMTRLKQTPCGLLVILSETKYPFAWIFCAQNDI